MDTLHHLTQLLSSHIMNNVPSLFHCTVRERFCWIWPILGLDGDASQTERDVNPKHSLPQSEAFQGDILPDQSSGVWELHFEVGGVFPGTWEKRQHSRIIYESLHLLLCAHPETKSALRSVWSSFEPSVCFLTKWVKWNKRHLCFECYLLRCPTETLWVKQQDIYMYTSSPGLYGTLDTMFTWRTTKSIIYHIL